MDKSSNKLVGEGVPFERTRRITGYLVGSLERFCNSKRKEEQDRVKHGTYEVICSTSTKNS